MDTFGLKIGVEGEKDFKNALSEINQTFKVLGSEMQLVSSQFDKNDKSTAALTSRNEVLNKEIDQQKEKITTLRAAFAYAKSVCQRGLRPLWKPRRLALRSSPVSTKPTALA